MGLSVRQYIEREEESMYEETKVPTYLATSRGNFFWALGPTMLYYSTATKGFWYSDLEPSNVVYQILNPVGAT